MAVDTEKTLRNQVLYSIYVRNYSEAGTFAAVQADLDRIKVLEKKVDHFEDALGTYLVKLSSEKLSPKDSQTLSMILHCIGDFERISDHTVNIMKAAREMHDKNLQFSAPAPSQ